LENKDWYYKNGIPYTLGIGLSGEPGTGKTSFFKCLANMTGRHLVVLSFKIIKTKTDLDKFFMEDRYNENNKAHDIGFDKKIIVIEDIDCMGDVILDRSLIETRKSKREKKKKTTVEQIIEYNETTNEKMAKQMEDDDKVTLDDILNLWDGLNETPGRILGISSNHYDKLDPALVRPGRIDITLKMEKATHNTIREIFEFHYGKKINESKLKRIKDLHFSPAQIINTYVSNKEDPEGFYKALTP
jgi:chaperone BCS1